MTIEFKVIEILPLYYDKLKEILPKVEKFTVTNVKGHLVTLSSQIDDEHVVNLFLDVMNNEVFDYNICFMPYMTNINDDFKVLWCEQEFATPIRKFNIKDDAYTLVFLTKNNELFMQSFLKTKVWKQGKIKKYTWKDNNYPLGLKDLILMLKSNNKF